jgi:hypothetical protein
MQSGGDIIEQATGRHKTGKIYPWCTLHKMVSLGLRAKPGGAVPMSPACGRSGHLVIVRALFTSRTIPILRQIGQMGRSSLKTQWISHLLA